MRTLLFCFTRYGQSPIKLFSTSINQHFKAQIPPLTIILWQCCLFFRIIASVLQLKCKKLKIES